MKFSYFFKMLGGTLLNESELFCHMHKHVSRKSPSAVGLTQQPFEFKARMTSSISAYFILSVICVFGVISNIAMVFLGPGPHK